MSTFFKFLVKYTIGGTQFKVTKEESVNKTSLKKMCSISLYSKPCWAIIFLTRLRFPPGTSIAMISLFTFECSEFHWKTMNIKHQTNQLARFSKSQNKLKLRNVLRMERFKNANICIPPTFQETVGSHLWLWQWLLPVWQH